MNSRHIVLDDDDDDDDLLLFTDDVQSEIGKTTSKSISTNAKSNDVIATEHVEQKSK